jgi:tetratricopeptide (TPR) repeat protein/tRNA A-37 threonylcarbamoyl transferase component Bud32
MPAPVLSSLPSQTPAMLQQAQPPGTGHGQQPVTGKPTLASYSATIMAPDGQGQARQDASALPMSRKGSSHDAGEPDSDSEEEQQGTHAGMGGQARASGESSADSDADEASIGEKDSDADETSVGDPDSYADIADRFDKLKPAARTDTAAHGQSVPMAPAFTGVTKIPASQINIGPFLANGAFGMVYRGTWGNTDVALKKINFEHARQRLELSREEVNEALEWEVARLATTQHPNIVQFHGICHKDGAPYLVLEFCHQGSLQDALHKGSEDGGPVPASRLWQWMLEISHALAYLHDQGMLHRDLKAENVLIDQYGRARLADLGVAQVDALLAESEASAVNQGLQDSRFIAPENVGGGRSRHSSKATDIYALGVVFWQMVSSGDLPSTWEDVAAQDPTYAAIKAGERMPIPGGCPAPLRQLIQACWRARPAERADIAEVLRQLQAMAPAMHPQHALLALTMHLEDALHAKRADARHYVPSQVTLQPIEGSVEQYWERLERHAGPGEMADAPRALQDVLDGFLDEPGAGALLLLGEGGLGKSLSTHVLADRLQQQWWQHFADPAHHARPRYLPLFIRSHVPGWTYAELKNACADILSRHGLQSGQATPLVFIDGYDECRFEEEAPGNLARHLGLPLDAKLIVTCRPGTVPKDQVEERFAFQGRLQSCHYLSFNTGQLLAYLKQHLGWDEATHRGYEAKLQGAAELRAALRNPFVLYLLWQSWETISKKLLEGLTRADIYDGFIEHMVSSLQGLLENEVRQQLQAGHDSLAASFRAYANETALLAAQGKSATLALASAAQTGSPWAGLETLVRQEAQRRYRERQTRLDSLSAQEKKEAARRMVLTQEDFVRLRGQKAAQLAASLPLRPRADSLEFIHKSVFEHCLAQRLVGLLAEDGERMETAALQALLEWTRTAAPEALMMAKEQLADRDTGRGTSGIEGSARQARIEAWLIAVIGLVLVDRQAFAEALAYQHRALAIREKVLGAEHTDTAESYNNIGLLLGIQDKLDQALHYYRKALAIREKVLGAEHTDTAQSYNNIGSLLQKQGKLDQALEYLPKALAIREKVFGADHADTAMSYNNIGSLLQKQGKLDQALDSYRKALAIQEKVLGADHTDTAQSYNNIGTLLQVQDKLDQALEYFHKALAIRDKVLGADHTHTAQSYNNIGSLLQQQGKLDQALEYCHKGLAIQEKVLGTDHTNTAYFYGGIGSLLQHQGKLDQALEYYRKALAIQEKVLGADHTPTALSYNAIGTLLQHQGKLDQALEYYRKALTIWEKVLGVEHTATARSYGSIGAVLNDQGKHEQAMDYLYKALAIRERRLGAGHTMTALSYSRIGEALAAQGRHDDALEHFRKALAIREKSLGHAHADTATSHDNIGAALAAQDQHAQALEHCRKALAIREELLDADHPDIAKSRNNIGVILMAQGCTREALEEHCQALAISERQFGAGHANTAASHNNIGLALQAQGQHEEALAHFHKALAMWEKVLGTDHADTARAHYNIGALHAARGQPAEALPHYCTALAIYEKLLGAEHDETVDARLAVHGMLHALGQKQ